MAYDDHFRLADDLITHLDAALAAVRDPFVETRYTGFLAVSAVTVLELATKTIFIDFASKKHHVFGHFFSRHFDRINGRIDMDTIRTDYVRKCGSKYEERFKKSIEDLERRCLKGMPAFSAKASYKNLLT